MKKSIAALTLAGSIILTGAVPAMAVNNYPAPGTCAAVSDGTVAPGETFTFSGTCFGDNEVITITVTLTTTPQALGGGFAGGASMAVPSKINVLAAPQTFTTTAASDGSFAYPLSLSEAGTYTLTATGSSGASYSTVVTVAEAGTGLANTGNTTGGSGAGLANTGADSSLVLWSLVGAGALAAGAASVVVVRRRANAEASA